MKLALFGASGRTGRLVLDHVLQQGHAVTALARTPEKLQDYKDRITIIPGDVMTGRGVEHTIAGNDAVISTLGPELKSKEFLLTTAFEHIIPTMKRHGIERLISMTGANAPADDDHPNWLERLLNGVLTSLGRTVLVDSIANAEQIKSSDLRWTIVRAAMLRDKIPPGDYQVGAIGVNASMSSRRADVAAFIVQQLQDDRYIHKMPLITVKKSRDEKKVETADAGETRP